MEYNHRYYSAEKILFADGEPMNIFDFNILQGNPETLLEAPGSIVLTKSLARKIFG